MSQKSVSLIIKEMLNMIMQNIFYTENVSLPNLGRLLPPHANFSSITERIRFLCLTVLTIDKHLNFF